MMPILNTTLEELDSSELKLVDISTLTGWELRAAWDDFKLGLELNSKIDKIAIYGDKSWQEMASKVGSWFVSGEIKSFERYDSAIEWVVDSIQPRFSSYDSWRVFYLRAVVYRLPSHFLSNSIE